MKKAKNIPIDICPGITGTLAPINHEQGWISVRGSTGHIVMTLYVPALAEPLYSQVLKNLSQQEIERLQDLYGYKPIKEKQ